MNSGNGKNLVGIGAEPRAPTPIPTLQSTWQSTSTLQLTRDEYMSQDFTVKDTPSGTTYLAKTLLCVIGEPLTTKHLVSILFHITQLKGVPRSTTEGIYVVAFLLKKDATTKMANQIAEQIKMDISP